MLHTLSQFIYHVTTNVAEQRQLQLLKPSKLQVITEDKNIYYCSRSINNVQIVSGEILLKSH